MPVRIYAFAKELGLDNKQLLDICDKVNIKGKGSALASLDDEEAAKVKDFIANESNTATAEPEAPAPMRPPVVRPANRKITEIQAPPTKSPPVKSAPEEPAPQPEVAEPAPVAEAPAEPPAATPAATEKPVRTDVGGVLSKLRRNKPETDASSMAPRRPDASRRAGVVRDLDQRGKGKQDDAGKRETVKRKSGLNVKIAAMPEVKQPTKSAEPKEKVQKPDIALPQDAIAKARTGAAPLEQFTKSSKAKAKKKGKGKEAGEGVIGEMPSTARRGARRDRSRREPSKRTAWAPDHNAPVAAGRRRSDDRRISAAPIDVAPGR